MTYQEIKSFINTYIVQNGVKAITGSRLNTALNALADYYGFDAVTVDTLPAGTDATVNIEGRTLHLGIPRGVDGIDGQNAVNPFKGWFTTSNIPTTGQEGDYCNVSNTSVTPHTVTIYRWSTQQNAFVDTGEVPDTAAGETFASSEELNQVAIDDSKLVNPVNTADPTKPVLAKAEDVMQLKAKLEGVTASDTKASSYPVADGFIACRNSGSSKVTGHYYTDTSRKTAFVALGGSKSVRFLGLTTKSDAYIVGYVYLNIDNISTFLSGLSDSDDLATYIIGNVHPFDVDEAQANNTELTEILSSNPEGANYIALFYDTNQSSGYAVKDTNFYCYLQSGETVVEMIPEVDDSHLDNPNNNSAAKAEDVMQLKAKLGGVSAEIEKLADYTPVQGKYDAYGNEVPATIWHRTEVPIPEGTRNIRFLGVKLRYGLTDENKNVGYAVGHYEEGAFVVDYRRRFEENTDEDINVAKEYSIDITLPNNELYFRTEVQFGVILNASNFYCYFTKGENVGDIEKRLSYKPLISRIKMLPAVKELGLSFVAAGQRFISSETTRTWFAFLRAGEKIIVSNLFSVSTYVCVGTASIDEPPHIVEAGGSMDAFPKLKKGSVIGDYSYEFTASENCYFWITYRFAQGDPTFTKICNFEEKKPSLLLGSPSLHWSEFTETDENISSKTAADVYAIYDELASNHPLWLKKADDIGYATLDSNLEIRHYVLGYQKATLQSTYAGENILYDDNGVNHDMPHIVISAGIHGDEKASVWGVARACKEIIESNEPWAVYIKSNFVIDVIPIVSPYSFNSNSRNMMVGGVSIDPNRDYSTFVLSESRAMRDFMLQTKAVCFIDCHNTKNSDTKERMFLSTPEGSMNAETANHLCMRLSSLMSMLIPESYPYPEDPKVYFLLSKATIAKTTTLAYFMGEMNEILSFTMESPRNNEFNAPTNACTLKASVLMTTLVENVIPALSVLSE